MSEFVLAAPTEVVGPVIGAERFARAARAAWPDARSCDPADGSGMLATAWIPAGGDGWDDVVLHLHDGGLALSIDARHRSDVAAVAAWWRSVVPADVAELWLFDATGMGWSVLRPGDGPDAVFGRSPS